MQILVVRLFFWGLWGKQPSNIFSVNSTVSYILLKLCEKKVRKNVPRKDGKGCNSNSSGTKKSSVALAQNAGRYVGMYTYEYRKARRQSWTRARMCTRASSGISKKQKVEQHQQQHSRGCSRKSTSRSAAAVASVAGTRSVFCIYTVVLNSLPGKQLQPPPPHPRAPVRHFARGKNKSP